MLASSSTMLPVGSFEMVLRLTAQDKVDYLSKFVPKYMRQRVVLGRFSNNVTYRVHDSVSAEERQRTRDQFKVLKFLSRFKSPSDPNNPFLPRLLFLTKLHEVQLPLQMS